MSLINREELLTALQDDNGLQYPRWWYLDKVRNAPAVDAVNVVRCTECKHYLACKSMNGMIEYYFCNLDAGMVTAHADDFCSRGVKKDGKND